MNIFLGILLAFVIFFIVVMIHEFGHFITARLTGMRVLEFWLGIPPKVKKIFTDKKWTEFTLNALPLGGFVRIDGEDIQSPDAFKDGNFMSKNWCQRVLVLIAGVVMNLLLAWIIFTGLFIYGAKPLAPIPIDIGATNSFFLPSKEEAFESGFIAHGGIILTPLSGGVSENAGVQTNDILKSVDGVQINNYEDFKNSFQNKEKITLEVERNSEQIFVEITPKDGKIESYIAERILKNENFIQKSSLGEAIILWAKETYYSSALTVKLVYRTLSNFFFPNNEAEHNEAKASLSGPIGVGNATIMMVENSVPTDIILLFVALLSISLAVMNILPFPALDGGRILFTTFYSLGALVWIPKQKMLIFEGYIHTLGFLLLIIFMIYVAWLDISRLIS